DNEKFSLSCNPDLTLDLLPRMRQRETPENPIALVAETNSELPYLGNDALIPKEAFDIVMSKPATDYPLFPVPQTSVSSQEHMIGFYGSTWRRDGGTLQVGRGALGSAVVRGTTWGHCNTPEWSRLYRRLEVAEKFPVV